MTLRKEVLLKYKTELHETFIESGTYIGDAVHLALDCGFKKIISVEISENHAVWAKNRFLNNKNVFIIHGDSFTNFPLICKNLITPSIFWLDGHYDKFADTMGVVKCPLLKELESIKLSNIKSHIILIDDVRVFNNVNETDWGEDLKIENVIDKIKQINDSYLISYEDGWVENDILIAHL